MSAVDDQTESPNNKNMRVKCKHKMLPSYHVHYYTVWYIPFLMLQAKNVHSSYTFESQTSSGRGSGRDSGSKIAVIPPTLNQQVAARIYAS